jgi:uncharacterized protein
MQPQKTLNYLLVKPSGPDCNLACSYCFYTRKETLFAAGAAHRMSSEVLEAMTKSALERPGQKMGFGWQGGEPTLMGLDFYRQAMALQQRHGAGMQLANNLQTNGLLIDAEWISFLKDHEFLVGLSLDGPAHVHDQHRINQDGKGSHLAVEKSAKSMLEAGVAVNALSVVSEYAAGHASEIYRYLKALGFEYLQFIPCLELAADGCGRLADYSLSPKHYGQFLCTLFDLWADDFVDDRPTTSVRLFETFACVYLSGIPAECSARRSCGEYLVVEHNGNVYSCDFFVEDSWLLGNIVKDDPGLLLNAPRQTLFGAIKAQRNEKCLRCPWERFCHGGCTKDRLPDQRGRRHFHFCESYKIFFSHANARFRQLMEALVTRYPPEPRRRRAPSE